jgi:hypothetical protein
VFKVTTVNGVIVLENVPENAVVEFDGGRITVTQIQGERVKIEAQPGKHGVIVKRGDVVLLGESVSIESGKELKLTVRLVPLADSLPKVADASDPGAPGGQPGRLASRLPVSGPRWVPAGRPVGRHGLSLGHRQVWWVSSSHD